MANVWLKENFLAILKAKLPRESVQNIFKNVRNPG